MQHIWVKGLQVGEPGEVGKGERLPPNSPNLPSPRPSSSSPSGVCCSTGAMALSAASVASSSSRDSCDSCDSASSLDSCGCCCVMLVLRVLTFSCRLRRHVSLARAADGRAV